MFRLTREVRFAINASPEPQLSSRPSNSHGGHPSLTGFGPFLSARVALRGDLDPSSSYLVNIKEIDETIRDYLEDVLHKVRDLQDTPVDVAHFLHGMCFDRWRERFESVSLQISPFLSLLAVHSEMPMLRLSQKFEFSASHRLFNRELSDEENRRTFGKCSNPNGHGHNYELQVTLAGDGDAVGAVLAELPAFERIVGSAVIDRFDHKNLNLDVPEFADLIPSVENIARVIYRILRPQFNDAGAKLASVTVWETPKTWCEYSE